MPYWVETWWFAGLWSFLTGGADSPFLLYSLLPIITASLFFEPRVTLIIAVLASLNLILAHTVFSGISSLFAPILQGNYLTIVIIYGIFCFLVATITYRTNLNVYRYIQSDAIAEERRRLRREIHDGIAQVMGYLGTKTNLLSQSLPSSEEKLCAELEEIRKVISESYQNIREDIDSLDTEPVSLIAALSSHTEQVGRATGSKTEFTAPKELPALQSCGSASTPAHRSGGAKQYKEACFCQPGMGQAGGLPAGYRTGD